MRSTLRIALVGLVAFLIISLGLLWGHRDDWRQHLHDAARYRPQYWSSSYEKGGTDLDRVPDLGDDHTTGKGTAVPPEPPSPPSGVEGLSGADDPSGPPHDVTEPAPTQEQPPPETKPERAVVMARTADEDTSWVDELPQWKPYVYHVDNHSAALHIPKNKGREGMAYLTYIIDNYDALADTVAFVHSHKDGYPKAWHTDNEQHSNVVSLNLLRTDWVQKQGYANLRCDNGLGCDPPEIQPNRSPKDPWRTTEALMPEAWKAVFGEDTPLPDAIGTACCAQFAASRSQILKRSLAEWTRYRQWLLETEITDDISGRIMEYFWHIMLKQDPVFCPDIYKCYCDVYGMCG